MLSELPGDILLCILDRLELRDAVRTSALSRRWRHLPGLLSNIILNVGAFEPTDSLMFTLDDVDDIVLRSNADTVEETKNILAHKSTSVIKLLSLVFYLREGFIDIAHSINDAMANRSIVSTKFQLLSGTDLRQRMGDDNLICGKCLLSFFYTCPRAFGCLEHLVISNARFGDSDIPNMLSTCKKLEYLSLIRVDLKCLPKLTTLMVHYWNDIEESYPLSLGYVPLLWMLKLACKGTIRHKNIQLSEFLGNAAISKMHLILNPEGSCTSVGRPAHNRTCYFPKIPSPSFSYYMSVSICPKSRLLKFDQVAKCNNIYSSKLVNPRYNSTVWDHECKTLEYSELYQKEGDKLLKWESSRNFKHHNLNVLSIVGFQIDEKFMTYIGQVAEMAINLEEILLVESESCQYCQFRPLTRYPCTEEEKDVTKKQICEGRSLPIRIGFGHVIEYCD
uniref:F-box domain-containing protein n=1 Tax=Oryza brachyantha TaxID=4533 RepID=J3LZ09_ORYBR